MYVHSSTGRVRLELLPEVALRLFFGSIELVLSPWYFPAYTGSNSIRFIVTADQFGFPVGVGIPISYNFRDMRLVDTPSRPHLRIMRTVLKSTI